MSTFPSVISTISDPTATNKLNSPSHSSVETAQNDAIKKVETFIGTLSSAVGTIMYDVRAVASDGGGHVQAANKGGTGQTALTKGDVLVASSSSVLSKLAIGSNNQVLTADSNQAAGVKWAGVANAVDIQNETFIYARASVMSGSVYGVKLSENPSILSDGLGLVIKIPAVPTSTPIALQVFTSSSGSVSALIKKTNLANPDTTDITASMIGIFKFDSVSSVFQIMNPSSIVSLPYVDLSTDQTIAGVKTFSSDPIIPDEAYGVGWNGVLEPPTKNAVYDKVETIIPVFGSGQTNRLGSSGTGTQDVAHGLGVTPKLVIITAMWSNNTGSAGISHGSARSTSTDTVSAIDITNASANLVSQNASAIIDIQIGSNVIADLSALDATNFTLNFTTMDGSAGSDVKIQWECFA